MAMVKRLLLLFLFIVLTFPTNTFAFDFPTGFNINPRIKIREGASSNWAGYAVLTNLTSPLQNAVTKVSGQWVIPTLLCTSATTYSSAWVGIDGYSDSTVEQTGTEHDCVKGQPQFSAWYELYPNFPKTVKIAVHAGDVISAEVAYISGISYKLTIVDKTTNQTFSTMQTARAKRESAEWIVEAPSSLSGVLPLANFQTIPFSSAAATISGITGAINNPSWHNDPITMATNTYTKASVSSLSADGSNFTVTWHHQ